MTDEERLQRKRDQYHRDKEKILAKQKAKYHENIELQRARKKELYYSNRERKLSRDKHYRDSNKETISAKRKEIRDNNKELFATRRLSYFFSVDIHKAGELLALSEGACDSCGDLWEPTMLRRHHVDHNHTTGEVRGILCNNCNIALGHLKESEERILALLEYNRKHNGKVSPGV